jgi:hypothetical protein
MQTNVLQGLRYAKGVSTGDDKRKKFIKTITTFSGTEKVNDACRKVVAKFRDIQYAPTFPEVKQDYYTIIIQLLLYNVSAATYNS